MLTDLGLNCFGDANIGPLCFLSIILWIWLSQVELLLKKAIRNYGRFFLVMSR
jgi:hypothetical protein